MQTKLALDPEELRREIAEVIVFLNKFPAMIKCNLHAETCPNPATLLATLFPLGSLVPLISLRSLHLAW